VLEKYSFFSLPAVLVLENDLCQYFGHNWCCKISRTLFWVTAGVGKMASKLKAPPFGEKK
jgi:hypothetical protein